MGRYSQQYIYWLFDKDVVVGIDACTVNRQVVGSPMKKLVLLSILAVLISFTAVQAQNDSTKVVDKKELKENEE